jgi:hypothetical protein
MGKKLIDFSVSPGLFPPFLGSSGEGETLTTFQVEESYTLKKKKKKKKKNIKNFCYSSSVCRRRCTWANNTLKDKVKLQKGMLKTIDGFLSFALCFSPLWCSRVSILSSWYFAQKPGMTHPVKWTLTFIRTSLICAWILCCWVVPQKLYTTCFFSKLEPSRKGKQKGL